MSKKINELETASTINNNDTFVINQLDEAKQITKEDVFANTEAEIKNSLGTDEYDNTYTYSIGDYTIYNNTLYRCTTEISEAEEFNDNHWTQIKILDEINKIQPLEDSVSELQANNSWNSINTGYGVLNYKKISNNLYFLQGSFTGLTQTLSITLPFTVSKQHVFFIAGSATYYSKAYINSNSNILSIATGTGTSATTYALANLIITN